MSTVIDMLTGESIDQDQQQAAELAALVVAVRDCTIAECQRLIRYNGELMARLHPAVGQHYGNVADLLEVLKS